MRIIFLQFLAAITAFCSTEELVVGTSSGYAPYVSLNPKGEYEGFDIDIAHLVAAKLKKKLVLKDLGSMPSLLIALKKEKIDAIIWAVSITEDRKKEMEMIYYQGEKVQTMPFLFWKKIPDGIEKIEDLEKLSKASICVEAGSSHDAVIQKYPGFKVRHLDKISDAIMELKFGKSAMTLVDHSLLNVLQSKNPDLKVLQLPLPKEAEVFGNGICINKKHRELAKEVQKIIDDLRKEGKIRELEKKWNVEG